MKDLSASNKQNLVGSAIFSFVEKYAILILANREMELEKEKLLQSLHFAKRWQRF